MLSMPPTSQRNLVSALLEARKPGIPLSEWIADQREDDNSWDKIAEELSNVTEGVVNVNATTVMRWAMQLGIPEKAAS